ncbi:hypothetical protein P175DRAFT_0504321 [Aspergillus ochraceoroseus IBT 24754]|uniref:Protein phosphatase 4 core regulatory subunit R2 n=3 Tax=Aspergillus subgen. Nidulantes TaxID=2720870 RepID=A0A0F8V6L0_9EURO|nr:uncharacterized protein P175DRAFT_0504321 [Aspergillus ochraceoroseus IBT 24754]KKK18611.1 hypothetical protein ARAM_004193 [Aspergillus rambellii]KKK21499.1 hypothetical protein AOCH_001272 [Aspergillus ochraceoroseus]PTU18399.1 hypothetical protein P175DRAFT_0504321 [Aspergillus ochraceoroseus IBT 24754]
MSLDEESLEIAANGGLMDCEKWPSLVEPLLERLEYIMYNVFVMPEIPPETPNTLPLHPPSLNAPTSPLLQDPNSAPSSSNKENAAPSELQTPPRPSTSSMLPPSSIERVPDSQPASQIVTSNGTLPAPLLLLLQSIKSTLRSLFSSKPPHTIQRLAELILRPHVHYKTLPAYLRAVDRVVSVTSTADVFPLPMQSGATQLNGVINGTENTFVFTDNALASDESLGGALLTPIPWLNNAASSETEGAAMDDDAGILTSADPLQQIMTQGVNPEQQQTIETGILEGDMMDSSATPADPADEIPHARGPSVLGVEDMGLQDGKGVQMTLLNTGSENDACSTEQMSRDQPAQSSQPSPENKESSPSTKDTDGDGDIALSDEPSSASWGVEAH